MNKNWNKVEKILEKDGVGILPTDTLYGLVGKALSKKAVKRIYKIKERNIKKPFIVLISSYKHLALFDIELRENQAKFLKKIWPGKVSIILPCKNKKLFYLHRGINSIAFRMIGKKTKNLFNLIKKVGPLVAPSANKENYSPAKTTTEARKYFDNDIDFYLEGGKEIFLLQS